MGFCLFQFSIKVESTFTLCAINFEALEIYYYDSLFMNFSNYVYDACQEIWEIVAGVHSMLIARSDQEIARQNGDVCCGAFVCYYATKNLSYDSCFFPPNFTILYAQIKEIYQTFQVYPRLSLICQRILHQKEVEKGKMMLKKLRIRNVTL